MTEYRPEHLDRLEPLYLQKYRLQAPPFSAIHEDRFLYLDAERSQCLNLLQHMTQYSNLLLMVMGAQGVGKTSLLQRFIATAQGEWRICQVTANTMMDAEQLLFVAAQGFGLQQLPHDATQLQDMLYARVATLHRQEQVPILVIDDAHTLPKEALLAIFHLADTQVDQGNLLRIILSCEPEIEKILQAKEVRALRERITHTMHIPPLTEDTTAEYIKHRMAVAGFSGISPFTPRAIKKIHKHAQGIPSRINELAHELLDKGETSTDVPVDNYAVEIPRRNNKVIFAVAAGVIAAALMLIYRDNINALFEVPNAQNSVDTITTPIATLPATAPKTETPTQEKVIVLDNSVTPTPAAEATNKNSDAATNIGSVATPPITSMGTTVVPAVPTVTPIPSAPAATVETAKVPTMELHAINPATVSPSNSPHTFTLSGQGFSAQSQVLVAWTGREKQLPAEQIKFVSPTELKITLRVGVKPDTWLVQVIDTKTGKSQPRSFVVGKPAISTTVVAPATESVAAMPGDQGEAWILKQDPTFFTLQLFGTRTHSSAASFIKEHKLDKNVAIFRSQNKGDNWYSVVHGSYATSDAAQQASKQLPAKLQKVKPWVRQFATVHAAINVKIKTVTPNVKPPNPKPANVVTTVPVVTNKPPFPVTAVEAQNEAWLWSQDPRFFTLQLLVAQQADNAEKFINQHALLRAKGMYFHTRKDRDLYVVVHGVYATHAQAEQAITELPADLRAVTPHIRSFASIHTELEKTSNKLPR